MRALISDIHGNHEALKAVFADIDSLGVEEVYFLGDAVGYGPAPEACIDLIAKRCQVCLMGNHDYAILNAPVGFNPIAAEAIWCLKGRMEPGIYSMPWKRHRWKFLGNLRTSCLEEGLLFVHASPREPVSEYILPSDPMYNPEKMDSIFHRVEHLAFCGHTHLPGAYLEDNGFFDSEALGGLYSLSSEKAVLNIGSVGQPRDGDPRACYAILRDDRVEWRRVDYDIEATIRQINAVQCLHPRNGERLRQGR